MAVDPLRGDSNLYACGGLDLPGVVQTEIQFSSINGSSLSRCRRARNVPRYRKNVRAHVLTVLALNAVAERGTRPLACQCLARRVGKKNPESDKRVLALNAVDERGTRPCQCLACRAGKKDQEADKRFRNSIRVQNIPLTGN